MATTSKSTMKRKRVVVSMDKKLEAINRIVNGESIKKIALEFGVGETTVGDWKRNEVEIKRFCNKLDSQSSMKERFTLKNSKSVELDEAMFLWFRQQRSQGVPLSGPIVQEKAKILNKKLGGSDNFAASQGWLDKFKKRHGIRQLDVSGEKLSSDLEAATEFVSTFKTLIEIEKLGPDQVYNADETGLYYKMLPAKTLASREEKAAPGFKKSKEHITLLACSNGSGEDKLPLLVIGKSAKPRALKNVNLTSLPVIYTHQKSAWMNTAIFEEWFRHKFVPHVTGYLQSKNLPIKAVLLLDNARSHPTEEVLVSGNIKAVFLPPNVTASIQPMDQGVLEALKRHYRRKLLSLILQSNQEETLNIKSALQSITIKDVIYMAAQSWNSVSSITIKKAFRKIHTWPTEDGDEHVAATKPPVPSNEELISMLKKIDNREGIENEDIEEWLSTELREPTSDVLTDEDIINAVTDTPVADDSSEDDDSSTANPVISHAEGAAVLSRALDYLEQRGDVSSVDLLVVRNWRDIAAADRVSTLTQKKLTDFFIKK